MAIIQDAFDIPADIMEKLFSGEYRRIGSVIRIAEGPNKGQIVKHLDPVDLIRQDNTSISMGAKISYALKKHKKVLIIVGVGGVIYVIYSILSKVKTHEPAVVTRFKAELRAYIAEIKTGNLTLTTINTLMAALDDLKSHKDFEKIEIRLSTEELGILISWIYNYTIHLAEINMVTLTDEEHICSGNAIVDLQHYLKTQKRIFESAA